MIGQIVCIAPSILWPGLSLESDFALFTVVSVSAVYICLRPEELMKRPSFHMSGRPSQPGPRDDEAETYASDVPETKAGEHGNYKDWRTYQMSDHLPMWIELRVDFSREYINRIAEGKEAVMPISMPLKA